MRDLTMIDGNDLIAPLLAETDATSVFVAHTGQSNRGPVAERRHRRTCMNNRFDGLRVELADTSK